MIISLYIYKDENEFNSPSSMINGTWLSGKCLIIVILIYTYINTNTYIVKANFVFDEKGNMEY